MEAWWGGGIYLYNLVKPNLQMAKNFALGLVSVRGAMKLSRTLSFCEERASGRIQEVSFVR